MTVSGRIVATDAGLAVDGVDIIAIDGCGPDDDGTFALGYSCICEVCDGHGFRHQQRCEYCSPDAEGRSVGYVRASLTEGDVAVLKAWALRHQYRAAWVMAGALLAGIKEWDVMVAGAQTERSPQEAA